MIKTMILLALVAALTACESLYEDDGIPRIRTQADVVAYNATVVADNDKLVCTRERVVGTNIPRFFCMTVRQRVRMQEEAQQDAGFLSRTLDVGTGGNVPQ
jgi:hypothetical protein